MECNSNTKCNSKLQSAISQISHTENCQDEYSPLRILPEHRPRSPYKQRPNLCISSIGLLSSQGRQITTCEPPFVKTTLLFLKTCQGSQCALFKFAYGVLHI